MLALQRRAGNQAVGRILQRKAVPKRTSPRGTGLRAAGAEAAFAAAALRFWSDPANRRKPAKDYIAWLVDEANATLTRLGVPAMNGPAFAAGSSNRAEFNPEIWVISVNAGIVGGARLVQDLDRLHAAAAAGTIYHEARHAEQYFRIAQLRAMRRTGQPIDSDDDLIVDHGIEGEAARAARSRPLSAAKKDARLLSEAKHWDAFAFGHHRVYGLVVYEWLAQVATVLDVARDADESSLDAKTERIVNVLKSWHRPEGLIDFLSEHTATMVTREMSHTDALVLSHVQRIESALDPMFGAWNALDDSRRAKDIAEGLASFKTLEASLRDLQRVLIAAYRDLPLEGDAGEAGKAVRDTFHELAEIAAKKVFEF